MAVQYKNAGAGAESGTSGAALSVPYPSPIAAGDILILQKSIGDITTAFHTPAGFELLIGPNQIGTIRRSCIYGKIADGTETGNLDAGTEATANNRAGRIYSFSGYVSGTIKEIIGGFSADTDNRTAVTMPTIRTPIAGCLACAFWSSADDNTVGTATGETGGDWVEPVSEYLTTAGTGADGTLKISVAEMASAGVIARGVMTASAADPYITQGLFIAPEPWS